MHASVREYLLAEHVKLVVEYAALVLEFKRRRPDTSTSIREKIREHRLLIANHRLALRWAMDGTVDRPLQPTHVAGRGRTP